MVMYNRAPTIYNSFIDINILKAIKNQTGSFFYSITPDVYSGLAVLSKVEKYIYSLRPFSINGASKHSTGTLFTNKSKNKNPIDLFRSEQDIGIHKKMRVIPNSIISLVVEALLQANDHCFNKKLKINFKKVIKKITKEILLQNHIDHTIALTELHSVAMINKVSFNIKKFSSNIKKSLIQDKVNHHYQSLKGSLFLDTKLFGVKDVYKASLLAGKILNDYSIPKQISSYSHYNKLYSRIYHLVYQFVKENTL